MLFRSAIFHPAIDYRLPILKRHHRKIIPAQNPGITGSLDATFSLECGRCLERFLQRVEMPDYTTEVPIEKETTMDLTELIREDILLTLPNFPRCENGNVDLRDCPAEGRFKATESSLAEEMPRADGGVWNALDKLK